MIPMKNGKWNMNFSALLMSWYQLTLFYSLEIEKHFFKKWNKKRQGSKWIISNFEIQELAKNVGFFMSQYRCTLYDIRYALKILE